MAQPDGLDPVTVRICARGKGLALRRPVTGYIGFSIIGPAIARAVATDIVAIARCTGEVPDVVLSESGSRGLIGKLGRQQERGLPDAESEGESEKSNQTRRV